MSKPNVEEYLANNLRFQGTLAGHVDEDPFTRVCKYWVNINQRILDDLSGRKYLSLKFEDLISGKVDALAEFLQHPLDVRRRDPVNVGRVRAAGKFPEYSEWSTHHKQCLQQTCGSLLNVLGYD